MASASVRGNAPRFFATPRPAGTPLAIGEPGTAVEREQTSPLARGVRCETPGGVANSVIEFGGIRMLFYKLFKSCCVGVAQGDCDGVTFVRRFWCGRRQ